MKKYGTKVQLPPKKLSGNLSKTLIDKRRQSLETYLQKLVHGESQVALSHELMEFLDVPTHVSKYDNSLTLADIFRPFHLLFSFC